MRSIHLATFAALSLSVISCSPSLQDVYDVLPAIGDPVPAFSYQSLDGAALTNESVRGAPTVIALWSTTCSASRLALESLGALHTEYASRGANIVILAEDRDSAAVADVFAQAGVRAPVALASGTLRETFTHDQSMLPWRKAFALPTLMVLNKEGDVAWRQLGIEYDAEDRLRRVRAVLDSLATAQ